MFFITYSSALLLLLVVEAASRISDVTCPDIDPISNADIHTSSLPPYGVGTVANFTCDASFKGIGRSSITCLKTGRWSGPVPYCTAYICKRDLSKISEDRRCRKRCKRDSQCRGAFKRCVCDDWCGKSCFNPDANCPKLSPPSNGYILSNGESYGHTATYGCNKGYALTGPPTRRCRSDRTWSKYPPQCVPFGTCGQPTELTQSRVAGKVIEGTNSKQGAWPWQALMIHNLEYSINQIYNTGSGFGGGSIINEEWVLSAAHVFDQFSFAEGRRNWKDKFLLVVGMTTYPSRGHEIPEHIHVFIPRTLYTHPSFNKRNFDYDVALIRVGQRMKRGKNNKFVIDERVPGNFIFSPFIRPVCLPCMKNGPLSSTDLWRNFDKEKCNPRGKSIVSLYSAGAAVMVTGFGRKTDHGDQFQYLPNRLQQGLLRILDTLKCAASVKEIQLEAANARFTNRMFCASGVNKTARIDTCQGDSGGPIVKPIKWNKHTNYWMQIGIVSWGWKCGGKHPGFYTTVSSIMSWIWKILDDTRKALQCPSVKAPEGGTMAKSLKSDFFAVGSNVTFSCNEGKFLSAGPTTIVCMPSGKWDNADNPVCTDEWGPWSLWTDCSATCGGVRTKVRKYQCQTDIVTALIGCHGFITATKKCGEETCPKEITCNVPAIRNGRVAGDNPLAFGSKAYFDCNSGYELRGASVATCTGSGLSPKEAPTCIEIIKYSGECPSGFLPFQLMCYRIFKNPQTYENAKRTCAKYGANLATVQSSLVNTFIKKNSPHTLNRYIIWIGLRSIDNRRTWESGVKYEGTQGVENNLRDGSANYCAAYEYEFLNFFRWRITYQSCRRSAMFVCETWKSSAKSYTVSTQWSFRGVYRPVNGLLTSSGRQVFYSTQSTRYLYHTYDQVSGLEGWFIGNYNIRGASAGDWYVVASGSHARYPDKIDKWRNRNNNWIVQIEINENNWWNNWSLFQCDVTCGQGMQTRRRRCIDGVPGNMECRGPDIDLQTCTLPICRDDKSIDSHIYKGKTYLFFPDRLPWQQASQACLINNMELATITNRQLAGMLSTKMRTIDAQSNLNENFWVNGREISDQWYYADGRTMVQRDEAGDLWNQGEPNGPDQSDCIELSHRGGLNDHPCVTLRRYICQEATVKNPCDRKPCRGIRLCVSLRGGYRCDCPIGTVEPLCTVPEPTLASNAQDLGACSSDPCFGDAICRPAIDSDEPSGFQCFCKSGWQGRLCDKVIVTCSDVVAPVHGSVAAKPPNSIQPYKPGTRLTFRCDSYYVIKGSTSVTCGKDGSWSTTLPTCEESG